jgi:pyruvate dehydrogenase E1 component alpha subunit
MKPDMWSLYRQMLRSRLFEEAAARLWTEGKISGEMHLGTGEEAVVAGVVDQLREGDALALDHRGTPPLLMRGVDPVLLLREFLGHPSGLCSGMGGHMHLFSPSHLAASSGIVGASGPAGAGFALAAQYLRPGNLAVAFFGEGAVNQGMMMETMNLAVTWKLPLLFVCKDNEWAIFTRSHSVIGGNLTDRARGFGMPAIEIDGSDVAAVWNAANEALERARAGEGPTFLHAHCIHLEGHFLGDPLLGVIRHPVRQLAPLAGPLVRSIIRPKGTSVRARAQGLRSILSTMGTTWQDRSMKERDPIERTRQELQSDGARLEELEKKVAQEIQEIVDTALRPEGSSEENGQ